MRSPTQLFCENQGRVYPCGSVAPNANKSYRIPLLDFLCSSKSGGRTFNRAAWKRRILRGQLSVDDNENGGTVFLHEAECPLPPKCRVFYHRPPWIEPVIRVVTALEENDNDDDDDDDDDPHMLRILYQDDHVLAVHKPSGLPTMPSQTYFDYSVLEVLRRKTSSAILFLAPPQPVHRLGVGTSGVLLVATSYEARKTLSASIRDSTGGEKGVKKIYRALVHDSNSSIPDDMRIDCPIGPVPFPIGGDTIHAACPHDPAGHVKVITNDPSGFISPPPTGGQHPSAKNALSLVRVVRRNAKESTAVVQVEIPTGRPHQIRIHMAYAGYPLVGDPLYLKGGLPDTRKRLFPKRAPTDEDMDSVVGGDDDEDDDAGDDNDDEGVLRVALPRDCGYSLHAYQITIEHPTIRGERMTFTATPPKALR